MKIFIAGATGTLGLPLVRGLVARGHQVTGLTRSPEKRPLLEQAGAAPVVADALDAVGLERAVRSASPECVVHVLTAIPAYGPTSVQDMAATNELRISGTANLLHAAIAAGATRLVAESMIFAYGHGDHGADLKTEKDPLRAREPQAWLQPIVDGLRSLESQLLAASREGQIEAIPLRYGLLYGRGNAFTQSMFELLKKRRLPLVGGEEGALSWIYIEDAVSATIAAIERGRSGEIYNVVDDEPVSMNEWIRRAAQAIGAPKPWTIPGWLFRRLAPYPAVMYSTRLAVDNSKARRELDWQRQYPTTWEGLRQAAR